MIGKTNAQTSASGGIKGEKVNIFLKTNQSSHEDLKGAIITVSYATVVEEYTWNGNTITVEIPPYVNYSVGVSNVEGYAAPSSYSSTSVPENAKSVELEYRTTIVKAVVKSNQSDTSDLANATLTVNGVALKNGQTTKIATGSTVTASWSDVTDYKKPSSTSVTISGTSQNIEGTYQTEIVSVTLGADDGSSVNGASVTINGKSHTWNGTAITQKVAFGVSYNVNVGALNGFSQPSSQSFTAGQALREVSFVYVASALKVNILSNQENDSNIAEVKATITYGDTTLEVASGQQVGIPTDTDVTITYPEVEGYKTPEAETFRNNNGGVAQKTGTYYTEIVYISTYADEGTPTGFVTTVTRSDGAVLGSFTTGMGIIIIPSGTTYTVSCSDVDGFETPSSKTYTADSVTNARRDISMGYKKIKSETLTVNVNADDNSSVDGQYVTVVGKPIVDNGVYIQDTEGKLWTESAWDGSKTPNGIAVITSECQFVMALKDTSNSPLYWGGSNVGIEGISSPTSASSANADYNGASNTDIIIKSLNGVTDIYGTGAPAAESCRNFIFPDGQKGYLGACGEWRAIYVNLSAVSSALNKCDGDALKADYSSSTQRSSTQYWFMRLSGTYTDTGSSTKSSPHYVRAFTPLENTETKPVTNGKATFKIPYDTEYTVSVDEKSGYTTPSAQTFTASQVSRVVSMQYEAIKNETLIVNVSASDGASVDGQVVIVKQQGIDNGVYVQDINGKLWTEATWNGSVIPNGIAVVTNECQFVMALEDVDAQYWAPNYSGVPGAFLTNFLDTAKTDYSGIVNTQMVVEKFSSDTGTAAYICQSFTFPNGNKGYLGAVGEWQAILDNKEAISSALSKCGSGGMTQTTSYWTSTMETAGRAWLCSFKDKAFTTELVNKDYQVRAFTQLGHRSVIGGKATFAIPIGTTYEVSVNKKEGYVTPASQSFTAASGTRTVSMQYLPLKITTIRINQTITDPTSMITRIVDKGGIEAVRANSHRYTGTFANGVMTLKQLSDTDGTKYKDGSTATLNSAGVDVWMRLPQFYWKCTQYATDQWDFSVAYDTKPDNSYKEWDGNDLIGVYEGYAVMSQLLSRSGGNVSYESPSNFKDYARNRGEGYTLVKWKHHCMMAMLFYMQYGHTNAQNKIGPGNTTNKKTGGTDSLGMTDTVAGGNGSSGSINFWGLENWWGNCSEFIDNVIINARAWSITEDDGTVRAAGTGCSSNGWTTKMMFGDYMDLIPTIANASESTGFCDYYYQATSSNRVVARSWNSNSTNGGVAAVDCQYGTTSSKSRYGTRLAFRGKIKIVG